jgi:hypothetical protein
MLRTIRYKYPATDDFQFYSKIIDIYTILKGIKRLSPTEMAVMAYLCMHGVEEGEKKIIADKRVASLQQYRNIRTQLVSWGLLVKNAKKKTYSVVSHLVYPERMMGFIVDVRVHENKEGENEKKEVI